MSSLFLVPTGVVQLESQWRNLYLHRFGCCSYPPSSDVDPQSGPQNKKGTRVGFKVEEEPDPDLVTPPEKPLDPGVAACERLMLVTQNMELTEDAERARRRRSTTSRVTQNTSKYGMNFGEVAVMAAGQSSVGGSTLKDMVGAQNDVLGHEDLHDLPIEVLAHHLLPPPPPGGHVVKQNPVAPFSYSWRESFAKRQSDPLSPFLHFLVADVRFRSSHIAAIFVLCEDAMHENHSRLSAAVKAASSQGQVVHTSDNSWGSQHGGGGLTSSTSFRATSRHQQQQQQQQSPHPQQDVKFTPMMAGRAFEATIEDVILLYEKHTRSSLHMLSTCLQFSMHHALAIRQFGERDYAALFTLPRALATNSPSIGVALDADAATFHSMSGSKLSREPNLSVAAITAAVHSGGLSEHERVQHAISAYSHPLLSPMLLVTSYVRVHGAAWCRPLMFSLIDFLGNPELRLYVQLPSEYDHTVHDKQLHQVMKEQQAEETKRQRGRQDASGSDTSKEPSRSTTPVRALHSSLKRRPQNSLLTQQAPSFYKPPPVPIEGSKEELLDTSLVSPQNSKLSPMAAFRMAQGASKLKRRNKGSEKVSFKDQSKRKDKLSANESEAILEFQRQIKEAESAACDDIRKALENFMDLLVTSVTMPAGIRHLVTSLNSAVAEHMLMTLITTAEKQNLNSEPGTRERLEELLELAEGPKHPEASPSKPTNEAEDSPLNLTHNDMEGSFNASTRIGSGIGRKARRKQPQLTRVSSLDPNRSFKSQATPTAGSSSNGIGGGPPVLTESIQEQLVHRNPIIRDVKLFRLAKLLLFDCFLLPTLQQAKRFGLLPPNATSHLLLNLEAFLSYLHTFINAPFNVATNTSTTSRSIIDTIMRVSPEGDVLPPLHQAAAATENKQHLNGSTGLQPSVSGSLRRTKSNLHGSQQGDARGSTSNLYATTSQDMFDMAAKLKIRAPFKCTESALQFKHLPLYLQRLNYDLGAIDNHDDVTNRSALEENPAHAGVGAAIFRKLNTFCWMCVDDFEGSRVVEELSVPLEAEQQIVENLHNLVLSLSTQLGPKDGHAHDKSTIRLSQLLSAGGKSLSMSCSMSPSTRHSHAGGSKKNNIPLMDFSLMSAGGAEKSLRHHVAATPSSEGYLTRIHCCLMSDLYQHVGERSLTLSLQQASRRGDRQTRQSLVNFSHSTLSHSAMTAAYGRTQHRASLHFTDVLFGSENEGASSSNELMASSNDAGPSPTVSRMSLATNKTYDFKAATMRRRSKKSALIVEDAANGIGGGSDTSHGFSSSDTAGASSFHHHGFFSSIHKHPQVQQFEKLWPRLADKLVLRARDVFRECDVSFEKHQVHAMKEEAAVAVSQGGSALSKVGNKAPKKPSAPSGGRHGRLHHQRRSKSPQRSRQPQKSGKTFLTQGATPEDQKLAEQQSMFYEPDTATMHSVATTQYVPNSFNGNLFTNINGRDSLTTLKWRKAVGGAKDEPIPKHAGRLLQPHSPVASFSPTTSMLVPGPDLEASELGLNSMSGSTKKKKKLRKSPSTARRPSEPTTEGSSRRSSNSARRKSSHQSTRPQSPLLPNAGGHLLSM